MTTGAMSDQCLGLVFQALSGRAAHIQRVDISEPAAFPDTWTAVRLGSPTSRSGATLDARAWDKVCIAHRAGHYWDGTFAFSCAGRPGYFDRGLDGLARVSRHPPESDLEVFFRLFSRPRLALTIFTVLEDVRVDERARARYPGLRSAYDETYRQELASRGLLPEGNPRRRLLEVLVRVSLGQAEDLTVPAAWLSVGTTLAELARVMRLPETNVHDAAIATLAAYELLDAVPTLGHDNDRRPIGVGDPAPPDLVPTLITAPGVAVELEGDEVLNVEVPAVTFRDSLSARVWSYAQPSRMRESIFRMHGGQPGVGAPVGEHDHHEHHEHADPRTIKTGRREPLPHEHTEPELLPLNPADVHGPLTGVTGDTYLYREWDHVRSTYVADRCRVREFVPAPLRPNAGNGAVRRAQGATLRRARDVLAGLLPERVRRTPGHQDGDEIDIDAAVEAVVDRRAGIEPSDRLYLRQEAVERDVAFALLVDLSASTADPLVDGADRALDKKAAHPDAAPSAHRAKPRRVLDVEKDSLLLLLGAMQLVGDASAAYGFSGSGPGDVRLAVVKETNEQLSDGVLNRLQSMKPIHMTRMGAAIRHVTKRFGQEQQTTKYLILISDGRPYDNDYGQQYGDEGALTYAVADTHKALLETVQAGIKPVIVTVDRSGGDYLRDMCGDLEYQVIDKAEDLPDALVGLYRRLSDVPS